MGIVVSRVQDYWTAKSLNAVKRMRVTLMSDSEIGSEYTQLEFDKQIALAERIINMRKGDIAAWRFYGIMIVGVAGGLKYLFWP